MLLLSIELGKYYIWQWIVLGVFLLIGSVQDIKNKALTPIICGIWSGLVILLVLLSRRSLTTCGLGLIPGVIMFSCAFLSNQAIGYGDCVAVLIIGLALGIEKSFCITATAFFIVAVVALFLLVSKKAKRKTELPFIPFLAFAFMVSGVV